MRVLYQVRESSFAHPGGYRTQVLETRRHLKAAGLHIDVSSALEPGLIGYDLVHIFSMAPENCAQCAHARRCGTPVVLSPIYWNEREFHARQASLYWPGRLLPVVLRTGRTWEAALAAYRVLLGRMPLGAFWDELACGGARLKRQALEAADVLLPNSEAEMRVLEHDFGLTRRRHVVVPNGVDVAFASADPSPFADRFGLRDFVLCVGVITARKNQLALIRALKGSGLRLVLIGRPNVSSLYYEKCRREADETVTFLDLMPHEDLPAAYAAARVHVLPSWFETPGLASLEAGLAGCQVVTTDRGSTREYFGDLAYYCDPADVGSIRTSVMSAFHERAVRRQERLKNQILWHFTWEKAAEATLAAYRTVLATRAAPAVADAS